MGKDLNVKKNDTGTVVCGFKELKKLSGPVGGGDRNPGTPKKKTPKRNKMSGQGVKTAWGGTPIMRGNFSPQNQPGKQNPPKKHRKNTKARKKG